MDFIFHSTAFRAFPEATLAPGTPGHTGIRCPRGKGSTVKGTQATKSQGRRPTRPEDSLITRTSGHPDQKKEGKQKLRGGSKNTHPTNIKLGNEHLSLYSSNYSTK